MLWRMQGMALACCGANSLTSALTNLHRDHVSGGSTASLYAFEVVLVMSVKLRQSPDTRIGS